MSIHPSFLVVLTSFGVLCCGALTGVLGLAAETGLVKTESRPGM